MIPAAAYGGPRTVYAPKCSCGRRLAGYLTEPWSIKCPRCGEMNVAGVAPSSCAA